MTEKQMKHYVRSLYKYKKITDIQFRNAFTDPYSELFEEKSFMNNGKYYNGVYEYTYTYSNFNDNYILNKRENVLCLIN